MAKERASERAKDKGKGKAAQQTGDRFALSPDRADFDAIFALVSLMQAHPGPAADRFHEFSKSEPEFKERFPHLFAMACEDGMDVGMLRLMMAEMSNGVDERCADVVGRALGDRFITPVAEAQASQAQASQASQAQASQE
jgi:hypothetical protein